MTFSQRVGYFFLSLSILLALALIEFFFLDSLVNLISDTYQARLISFVVMIILFNPFITYKIMELIPFKVKGLKVEKGVNESLKQRS